MDANDSPPTTSRRKRERQSADRPRRKYDRMLERGFYVGALAVIGLMESATHLLDTPRMPWVYFALLLIAAAYGMHRLRPFRAWRAKQRMARRQRNSARANDGNDPGAVRVSGRTSGT